MQNIVSAVCISSLSPFIFEKWMPLFFITSRFPKRGIKRRSMKVARKVAVAFCVSSLLSSCSALQEILQSSLRIPHHFIKTWLEGVRVGGGAEGLRGGPTYTYVVWGLFLWQRHRGLQERKDFFANSYWWEAFNTVSTEWVEVRGDVTVWCDQTVVLETALFLFRVIL